MTRKYRKKPIVIEAIKVAEVLHLAAVAFDKLPPWLFGNEVEPGKTTGVIIERSHVIVRTLEGDMRAEPHDWIIRGVKGELYPCKPDIFAATYDEAPP